MTLWSSVPPMKRPWRAVAVACVVCACSVGEGIGEVRGPMHVALCDLNDDHYDLAPNFFGGDFYNGSFTIRLQNSGDNPEFNDELLFLVDSTEYVANHLNQRLPIGPGRGYPVHAVMSLNRSCGRVAVTERGQNVSMEAQAGYIVFQSIYRGTTLADANFRLTSVSAFAITLRDLRPVQNNINPETPEPHAVPPSRGELDGSFQFYFARGRPAQRFP